jgi:hypothetical protein
VEVSDIISIPSVQTLQTEQSFTAIAKAGSVAAKAGSTVAVDTDQTRDGIIVLRTTSVDVGKLTEQLGSLTTPSTADMGDPDVSAWLDQSFPTVLREMGVTAGALGELYDKLDTALNTFETTDDVGATAIARTQ